MLPIGLGLDNGLGRGCARDAPPLERRQHQPPDLIDVFFMPGGFPVAHRPDGLACGLKDDLKHPAGVSVREPQFTGMTLGNLPSAFVVAQISGHLWIPQRLLIEG
jgi:hypothetical protein